MNLWCTDRPDEPAPIRMSDAAWGGPAPDPGLADYACDYLEDAAEQALWKTDDWLTTQPVLNRRYWLGVAVEACVQRMVCFVQWDADLTGRIVWACCGVALLAWVTYITNTPGFWGAVRACLGADDEKPTHCYIGTLPCGCYLAACVDNPEHPKRAATAVKEMIEDGLEVSRVALAEAKARSLGHCAEHAETK